MIQVNETFEPKLNKYWHSFHVVKFAAPNGSSFFTVRQLFAVVRTFVLFSAMDKDVHGSGDYNIYYQGLMNSQVAAWVLHGSAMNAAGAGMRTAVHIFPQLAASTDRSS